MDSAHLVWISLLLLSAVTSWDCGVSGGSLWTRGAADGPSGGALRAGAPRRAAAETHRERCAELWAPWQENAAAPPRENGTLLQLRVQPVSPGTSRSPVSPVFPGKALISFVRRVYRCCREGALCRSVKGIPGRLRGDRGVDFLLSRDISSLAVLRAELHLQLSNPRHLDIRPVLSALAKRNLPTRYRLDLSRVQMVELRVDLLLLLQSLQGAAADGVGGDVRQVAFPSALQEADGAVGAALELGLVLGCSQAGSEVCCGTAGVHLSHTPFVALYYR